MAVPVLSPGLEFQSPGALTAAGQEGALGSCVGLLYDFDTSAHGVASVERPERSAADGQNAFPSFPRLLLQHLPSESLGLEPGNLHSHQFPLRSPGLSGKGPARVGRFQRRQGGSKLRGRCQQHLEAVFCFFCSFSSFSGLNSALRVDCRGGFPRGERAPTPCQRWPLRGCQAEGCIQAIAQLRAKV